MERFDKYWIGILLGLLMPALFAYAYIRTYHLETSIQIFGLSMSRTWSKLLLLSVFPDLAFVFVFYAAEAWKVSKGLLIGAFPYLLASIAFIL